ncbi:hypothetical protein MCEMSEM23_01093 [Rhabdaerophilaceae bacterium]
MKSYSTTIFFGVQSKPLFFASMQSVIDSLEARQGIYTGDNLFTYNRNLSFLDDTALMDSLAKNAKTEAHKSMLWRYAVNVWGLRQGLRLDGDFVDFGCGDGVPSRIACDAIALADQAGRRLFLHDSFDNDPYTAKAAAELNREEKFNAVKALFADMPCVTVSKGTSAETQLADFPEKIAFMRLASHSSDGEIAVLDSLFDRMVPGSVLVLDHYGWSFHRNQQTLQRDWFAGRGYHVVEYPTGQGMVVKRKAV